MTFSQRIALLLMMFGLNLVIASGIQMILKRRIIRRAERLFFSRPTYQRPMYMPHNLYLRRWSLIDEFGRDQFDKW